MTAIFGIWRDSEGDAAADIRRQASVLRRFGRDAHDEWDAGAVGLGIVESFCLPEDAHRGDIHARGRRYAVVADVHLSERSDLIASLDLGDEATLMSDAAVVAAALERWDEGAFDRIYGAFAIAAWDVRDQRLLLARDPLGERPLFYCRGAEMTAFASMPEGLHALHDVEIGADVEQYARLLRDLPLANDRTPHKGIARVMPGHYVDLRRDGIARHRWWHPELTPLMLPRQRDYETTLAELLEQSVEASLRGAGASVGAHLSSGFDSSTVVAIAADRLASRGGRVVAFTAVPRADSIAQVLDHHLADESDLAAQTAARFANVEHIRIRTEGGTLDALDRSATIYPLPIRNLCNLTWNDAINDAARDRGIKVLLQGGMGNMTISEAGVLALPELFTLRRGRDWLRIARGLVRNGWMAWRGVLWNSVAGRMPFWIWRRMEAMSGRAPIATRRFSLLRNDAYAATRMAAEAERSDDPFSVIDTSEYEQPRMTSVQNRLSMAAVDAGSLYKAQLGEWGIDVRDPTANRRLVEFSLRVPVERLIWDGEPRAILRKVMAGRVPAAVLDNRKRGLQSADWHVALLQSRQELLREVERVAMYDPVAELIDTDRLQAMADDLPEAGSDRWQQSDAELDYRYALLRTVSIASHMRRSARSNL